MRKSKSLGFFVNLTCADTDLAVLTVERTIVGGQTVFQKTLAR